MPSHEASSVRYARHRSLLTSTQWERLGDMRIVVAGAGGLGTHVLDALVRLAPLQIEIWDPGVLDEPDLNRQSLYAESDLGRRKVEAARERLLAINPEAHITTVADFVTAESSPGKTFLSGIQARADGAGLPATGPDQHARFDVCFDCLDSFPARAALELAVTAAGRDLPPAGADPLPAGADLPPAAGIPIVHGGVGSWFGQVAILYPPTLGYAALLGPDFADIPGGGKEIMPHVVAAVAALQVGEFLRLLREEGEQSRKRLEYGSSGLRPDGPAGSRVADHAGFRPDGRVRLLTYDGMTGETSTLAVKTPS